MKYITVVVLCIIFSLAAMISGVWGLFFNTAHIFKAQDRLLAAMLGWDGKETVSRECGKSECRFCKIICKLLHKFLEPNHCEKEGAK